MSVEEAVLGDLIAPGAKLIIKHSGTFGGALWTAVSGKDLYLYGPSGAGKSSFIKYMVTSARTNPDEDREPTRTEKTYYYRAYCISGRSDQQMAIRRLRDRPGNATGEIHGKEFLNEFPHHSVILLDSTIPFQAQKGDSISKFLADLFNELKRSKKELPDRVYRIWIVLNKIDEVLPRRRDALLTKVKKLSKQIGKDVIHPSRLKVRKCSLIEGEDWVSLSENLLNEILTDMAHR